MRFESLLSVDQIQLAVKLQEIKAALKLIFLLWWDSISWCYVKGFSKQNKQAREAIRAKWLTRELLHLGSAFIKLGQLLSARPDVLPPGWVVELENLQDRVPPFSFEKAEFVLECQLKDKCKKI